MTNKERIIAHNNLIDRATDKTNNLPEVAKPAPKNPVASQKEVNFYDYDGTVRYSYTVKEFQNLTELPPLPKHNGLICQGWNYDLDTIKSYNRAVDVGTAYTTDDGKTRLYIKIANEGRMDIPLILKLQNRDVKLTIEWGDGESTFFDSEGWTEDDLYSFWHTYQAIGTYTISISYYGTGDIGLGYWELNQEQYDKSVMYKQPYYNMLQKAEISSYISLGAILENCSSLKEVILPNTTTNVPYKEFKYCSSLTGITIPNTVKTILSQAFYGCYSLSHLSIPNSVSKIEAQAFADCYGMAVYDFSTHSSIPTLDNSNAFINIPSDCVIRVPSFLYNDWIAATNWSVYADHIVPVLGLITFVIKDKTYYTDENMTWAQWLASGYNTDNYFAWNSGVRLGDLEWVTANGTDVSVDDTIIVGATYQTREASLPKDEYIEYKSIYTNAGHTTSRAYIDLGLAFDTAATIKIKYTAGQTDSGGYPFGATDSTGVYRCLITEAMDGEQQVVLAYGSDGQTYYGAQVPLTGSARDLTLTMKNGAVHLTENNSGQTGRFEGGISYTMTDNLYLGAQNYKGSARTTGAWTFESFDYYDKDNHLICKLIPSRSRTTGKVGMYDIIREQFLTSIGSGEFQGEPADGNSFKNWARYSTETDDTTIYNSGLGYKDGYRVRSGGAEGAVDEGSCTGFIPVSAGDEIFLSGWDFSFSTTNNAINVANSSHTNIGQFTSQPAAYGIFTQSAYTNYAYSSVVQVKPGVWKWTVPPAESGVAYIRVSGLTVGMGATMIITKNEDIL